MAPPPILTPLQFIRLPEKLIIILELSMSIATLDASDYLRTCFRTISERIKSRQICCSPPRQNFITDSIQ